ncbi:MAG TPA: hypothetical protein VG317_01675 [Pseudonocardiaceae bacterium]|jgi:hypothetical protein|nr:hypothetical protein [Pseudonocardiaceae bacterium]
MTAPTSARTVRPAHASLASVSAVTARTSESARSAERRRRLAAGWPALPVSLRSAVGLAAAGAVLLAIGPLSPVVTPSTRAGFEARPLLFVLGLLPAGVAVGFALRGRQQAVGGALMAAALVAPGQLLMDAQLLVNGSLAVRPELAMPATLATLHGDRGAWLLLVGLGLTIVAGLLAAGQSVDRASRLPGPDRPGARQGPMITALCLGIAASIGLVSAPFSSDDVYLIASGALDGPPLMVAGGLMVAVAVPLAALIGAATVDAAAARGWLLGVAAVLAVLSLPRIVSGLAVAGLHPAWGPYLALIAAAGLALLAGFAGRTAPGLAESSADQPGEMRLPGQIRLHLAAGAVGVLAAVAALAGSFTSLFSGLPALPPDFPQPDASAGRLVVPAAVLVGLLGAALLVPRWAAAVRPAFAVAWVAIPLTGAGAVDAALSAGSINGVALGPGLWLVVLAALASVVAGCCAGLAGGVERDDVDLTDVSAQPMLLAPAVAAVLLSFGALGLPVSRGDYLVAGLWSDFRIASWGLALGLVAVIVAVVLAPFCRPARATALLLGAAGVVVVRLLELPLAQENNAGISAASGAWLAGACAVALVAGAGVSGWSARTRPAAPVARR